MRLDFNAIRGDIYGGVTAAAVALPLALAFGVVSGFGAIAGLYGAKTVGFLAAIFGVTRSQISALERADDRRHGGNRGRARRIRP